VTVLSSKYGRNRWIKKYRYFRDKSAGF